MNGEQIINEDEFLVYGCSWHTAALSSVGRLVYYNVKYVAASVTTIRCESN